MLSEELFRDALVRERKRADRFEEAFVLVLISLDRRNAHAATVGRTSSRPCRRRRSTPT